MSGSLLKTTPHRRSDCEVYRECPALYAGLIKGTVKIPTTRPMYLGSVAHALIGAYLKHLKAENLPTDWSYMTNLLSSKLVPADAYEEVKGFADHLRSMTFKPQTFKIIEELHTITLPSGREIFFEPDLVAEPFAGDLEITDWKTGWLTQTDVDLKDDLQAKWYVVAAWRMTKGEYATYRFRKVFLRHGEKCVAQVSWSSAEVMHEVLPYIEKLLREIDEHPRTEPQGYCRNCVTCPLAEVCPIAMSDMPVIMENGQAVPFIPESGEWVLRTEAEAAALSGWAWLMGSRLNAAKKALESWADDHGGKVAAPGGKAWQFRSYGKRSWPGNGAEKAMQVLRDVSTTYEGLDAGGLASLDKRQLERFLRQLGKQDSVLADEISAKIATYYTEKSAVRFACVADNDSCDEE